MAVSIGISVAQNSQDVEMNNSTVTIQVIAYFTAGSYNKTSPGPLLQLYVDGGLIDSCNVGFNTAQLTSGSELIYSNQFVVDHNSDGTRTLNVSAIYESGVSSGTVTASTSKELTKINTSSGGGGSSGDTSEDNLHTITIQEGEHTSITVWSTIFEEALGNESQISDGAELVIYFSADDGYELSTHTVNGVEFTSGKTYYIYEDIVVKATAVVSSGSGGDTGGDDSGGGGSSSSGDDNTSVDSGISCTENCTIINMYSARRYVDSGTWYDYTNSKSVMSAGYATSLSNGSDSGYDGGNYCSSYIQFTVPDFVGKINYVKFKLDISECCTFDSEFNINDSWCFRINYALCGSNENASLYSNSTGDSVTDVNQIASGIYESANEMSTLEIVISTEDLKANKTYYLFLYPKNSYAAVRLTKSLNAHSIEMNYNVSGLTYIDNGTEFSPYQCYIDNGSSWDLYIPYIDSGSSWNMCT